MIERRKFQATTVSNTLDFSTITKALHKTNQHRVQHCSVCWTLVSAQNQCALGQKRKLTDPRHSMNNGDQQSKKGEVGEGKKGFAWLLAKSG